MEHNQTIEPTTQEAPSRNDLNIWDSPTPTQEPVTPEPEKPIEQPITPVEPITPAADVTADPPKTEPVIQEKIVEKIVEKLPEFKDDYSKQMFEAIQQGKENELYEYLSKKNKNYETMSDVEVVKENLKLQNPKWSDKDIDIEIKSKFGALQNKKDLSLIDAELEPEQYEKAVEFNNRLEDKELLLSREARDARIALEESKKTIEFPKVTQDKAPEATPLTQEQIDELNQKWDADVTELMPKLPDFKFKVGDEEVVYKITDQDRADQSDYMKKLFTGEAQVAKDLGWIDENGKENILKIAEDMLKLKHFDKVVTSSASQFKTLATKEVVASIKNIDLQPTTTSLELSQSVADTIWKD